MTTNQLFITGFIIIIIGFLLLVADLIWNFVSKKRLADETDVLADMTLADDEIPELNVSKELNSTDIILPKKEITIDDGFNHKYDLPVVAISSNQLNGNAEDTLTLSEDMTVSEDTLLYNDIEITNNSQPDTINDDFEDNKIDNQPIEFDDEEVEDIDLNLDNEDTIQLDEELSITTITSQPTITYAAGGRSSLSMKEDVQEPLHISDTNIDIIEDVEIGSDIEIEDIEIEDIEIEDIEIEDIEIEDIEIEDIEIDSDIEIEDIEIDSDIDDYIEIDAEEDSVITESIAIEETLSLEDSKQADTDNAEPINLSRYTAQSPILDKHLQMSDEQDQNSPLLNAKDNVNISILPTNEFSYISGTKLLELVDSFGFKFGTMNMFHRYQNKNGSGLLWFSMMGLTKDGIVPFDINTLPNTMELKGLVLFLSLPHPKVLQGFDSMMSIAGLIAREVDGFIVDDEGNEMTPEYKRQMRVVLQNSLVD